MAIGWHVLIFGDPGIQHIAYKPKTPDMYQYLMRYSITVGCILLCITGMAQTQVARVDSINKHIEPLLATDHQRAGVLADSLLAAAKEEGWQVGIVNAMCLKAKYLRKAGDIREAKLLMEETLQHCGEALEEQSGEGRQLLNRIRFIAAFELANITFHQGKYETSEEYAGLAHTVLDGHFNTEAWRDFYTRSKLLVRTLYGQLYFVNGELEKAAQEFEQCALLNEGLGQTQNANIAYLNMGVIYQNAGKLAASMRALQKARKMAEENDYMALLAKADQNMGQVFYSMRRYDKALEKSLAAYRSYTAIGQKYGMALSAVDAGDNFKKLAMPDSALWYYERSLSLHEAMENSDDIAYLLDRLASLQAEQERYAQALVLCDRGLSIARDNGLREEQIWLNSTRTQCLLALGRLTEAKAGADLLLAFAEETENISQKRDIYEVAHKVYHALGSDGRAYDLYSRYEQYQDSIIDEDKSAEVTAVRFEYQLEQERERLLAEQERQELLYEQELLRERWQRYAAIGAALLLAIVAFFAWRSYKVKKEASERLAEKNRHLEELRLREQRLSAEALASKERELATMAMTNHEKNSLLQELERKVQVLESHTPDDLKAGLREMKRTISDSYSLDKSWDSFLHKFNDVHPQFFDKLKDQYPALTINDLKLSAYLRIGMSNKDIAVASSLAPSSVKSKINRLKKKMNMGGDDNVRDYMIQYL